MSDYLETIRRRVEEESKLTSQNYLQIIISHEYAERKRKEELDEPKIPLVKPGDWGYKLDSNILPPSGDLPR